MLANDNILQLPIPLLTFWLYTLTTTISTLTASKMTSLGSLPNEILFQIFRDSPPQELCRLSFVCKKLGFIASPCLWSDIELHEKGYHESSSGITHSPPYRTAPRHYNNSSRRGWQSDICMRAKKLFVLLQSLRTHDETRLKQLTSRVRSLCTVIEPSWQSDVHEFSKPISIWSILPYFTRLESLELHGCSDALRHGNANLQLRSLWLISNSQSCSRTYHEMLQHMYCGPMTAWSASSSECWMIQNLVMSA
jgi:hypothetical protein